MRHPRITKRAHQKTEDTCRANIINVKLQTRGSHTPLIYVAKLVSAQ
jgi:hypothetical protein